MTTATTAPAAPLGSGAGTGRTSQASRKSGALGKYEPGLDGMRAVAMIVIFGYHSQVRWTEGAFLALSQFFTLSGFLITGILLRRHLVPGGNLRSFWTRRARRLMPAAFLALALVVVFGATVATRQQTDGLPGQVAAAATWTANWHFIITGKSYINLFAAPSPVQHFWSLAIEEQFYILLPIGLFFLLRRTRSPRVLGGVFAGLALVSTAWMIALYEHGASLDRLYYGTDTRMAELLVGSVLAVFVWHHGTEFSERTRWILAAVGLAAFAATVWCWVNVPLADGPIWRGGFLLFSIVSCFVILGVLSARGPLAAVLSWGLLAAIGRITYGLYLYHWPIFLWLTEDRTGLSTWPLFGLRLVVTFAAAILSYHYIERPILRGSSLHMPNRVRYALAPAIAIAIVVACLTTVNRSAYDPLAALNRAKDSSQSSPSSSSLRMLVIPPTSDDPVVAQIEKVTSSDPSFTVTVAPPFSCTGGLVPVQGGKTCSNWARSWPALVKRVDPDVVLLYVDQWNGESIASLSGRPVSQQAQVAASILNPGLDLLTARGARIVWAYAGGYEHPLQQYYSPLNQAMLDLKARRGDVFHVIGLPDPNKIGREQFASAAASTLIEDARLNRRHGASGLPRVMIVGDSQALSLGYGIDKWATDNKRAEVWNRGAEGCGVAVDGKVHTFGSSGTGLEQCKSASDQWPAQIKDFQPNAVIVLSSLADIQERQIPGDSKFRSLGDPELDSFLVAEYEHVVDVLSANGARVVWMTPPCTDFSANAGQSNPYDASNIDYLITHILPKVQQARPNKMVLFDLAGAICPNGKPLKSVAGGKILRPDGVHFSVDGSVWFAQKYGDALLKAAGS